jgi:methyl-accepting chemotaxis protein
LSDVPAAQVVKDGKLGGDAPKGKPEDKTGPVYKRKLSNYLLDKKLQLRYVLLVTILSGLIAGSLGYLIYQQSRTASESLETTIAALTEGDPSWADLQAQEVSHLESSDRALIYTMAGFGVGLVAILSAYLVIMTHKVAGPLYKVSMYFDRMARGKLGNVTALRKGDMLQDFYGNFREMHEAVRTRLQGDVITMESAATTLRQKAGTDPKLAEALDEIDKHVTQRKKQLL